MYALLAVLLTVILPYMTQIRADLAQHYATGVGVTVAVIDTGADLTHPVFDGIDVDTLGADVTDTCNHGTGVAGIVASIAPDARLLIIKDQDCAYLMQTGLSIAIRQAVDEGADIINLSLYIGGDVDSVREAIAYAIARHVLVVASAGNNSNDDPFYPAVYPGVLVVGGVGVGGGLWRFSNWGDTDLVAPSDYVSVADIDGSWYYQSGTSLSAPQVSGAAALVLEMQPGGDVRNILQTTATDLGETGPDEWFGWGQVDAFEAVADGLLKIRLPVIGR